jgi:hypothetical protein
VRQAVALLQEKAPEDVDGYKQFVLEVAGRVAEAHKEGDQAVSPEEQEAIANIESALG